MKYNAQSFCQQDTPVEQLADELAEWVWDEMMPNWMPSRTPTERNISNVDVSLGISNLRCHVGPIYNGRYPDRIVLDKIP